MRYPTLSQLGLAAAAIFAVAYTPVHLVMTGYSYPDFLHENIGFRFFWTMRWLDGAPDDFIHPGQGVLLPFIQAAYYEVSRGTLWERINTFADLTAIGAAVADAALLLLISLDRKLSTISRISLLIAPVVMAIGHAHVISYHRFPDYHAYEKVLLLCSAWVFVREFVFDKPTVRSFAVLGVLAGLVASLKINLGPLVLLLAASQGPIFYFGIATAVSAFTYALLLLLYYGPHLDFIRGYFDLLLNLSGTQWPLVWPDLSPFASWADHSMSNLGAYLILCALLLMVLARTRPRLSAILFLMMTLSFAMTVKRGGGASYFDAVVVILLLIAIAVAALPARTLIGQAAIGLLAINLSLSVAFNYDRITMHGTPMNPPGQIWQRDLFNWNRSHGLPIYAIFPENHFIPGTIEDMIMRGFSNFMRTWYESNENPSRRKLFPGYSFGSYDLKVARPAVLLWTEAKRPFPFQDDFEAHNRKMKAITSDISTDCVEVHPPAATYLVVHSCVLR
jgi:hypothetical protein